MQRSLSVARQIVTKHARVQGGRATYSTFVDLGGVPHQYTLPLTLLPIARADLPPHLQPLSLYPPPNTAFPPVARSDHSVALAIFPAWHVTHSSPLLPLTRLENTLETENVERPEPEKPKWEEEEYPEIGKGNFSHEY